MGRRTSAGSLARSAFLWVNKALYAALRPLVFRFSAQTAHEHMLTLLRGSDRAWLGPVFGLTHRLAFRRWPVTVGGVTLDSPLILAAGLVKGDGFEAEALQAATRINIMPGWRSMPRLLGPVEFGSFTRWPRVGNPGPVVWRDVPTRSTQNRVGLRNPGCQAAAVFLAAHRDALPAIYGINIAVSPGVDDPAQQAEDVLAALSAFVTRGVLPAWFTLNLSCPNTGDDPGAHQTTEQARQVCGAAVDYLASAGHSVPLWVKLGPTLADQQYRALMRTLADVGVRAVIATNTQPEPTPGGQDTLAGVGGGRLHARALHVAALLVEEKTAHDYPVDVIGCGGVLDGVTFRAFADVGVWAVQYWSALVYRGPLAAALIMHEAGK
ncbi:MAG: hypothetical protein JXJ20_07985 [Anaerolineae bacterium]|nr:hypothetical protein [Anaerolineae bacterium]